VLYVNCKEDNEENRVSILNSYLCHSIILGI
jgi:hypothetical protein